MSAGNYFKYESRSFFQISDNLTQACSVNNNDGRIFNSTEYCSSGMMNPSTNEKEMDNMSFVGIIVLPNRVIGFADSKSSKKSILGYYQDPERELVQKLFKNDQSVITAYGCNEYYDKFGKKRPLDGWINKNFDNTISPENLALKLHEELLQSINNQGLNYAFLIGSFDENGYYKRFMNVEYDGYYTGIKCYNQGIYTGGNEHYMPFADEIWGKLQSNGLSGAENSIKSIISDTIDSIDKWGGYNPVGGPIITETLYRK